MYILNDKYFTYHVFRCIKPSANLMLRHSTYTIKYNMKKMFIMNIREFK